MGVFYMDDGIISLRYPEWIQGDLNIIIDLFQRILLIANVARYKIMMCQTVIIWSVISEKEV